MLPPAGAVALLIAANVSDPNIMFFVMLFNAMVYMPTIALANTISYICLEKAGLDTIKISPVRVFGTIGFIFAMWAISLSGFELSNIQLYIASGAALVLAIYALSLPSCPTSNIKKTARGLIF